MKLKVEHLYKSFMNDGKVNEVLKDLSFEMEEGEIITLLGPSGCGKSTLLTTIAGFQKQDSGNMYLNGKEIVDPGPDKAFMFQSYALFPWMTVEDNIKFPMKQAKIEKEDLKRRLDYLIHLVRLDKYRDYYPHQLSGGMKQRVALVRALALEPEILLMDEPLGALDIEIRQTLQDQLLELFGQLGLTVIIVTHDVNEAIYLSDRVLVMSTNKGEFILDEKIELSHPRKRDDEKYREYERLLTDKMYEASIGRLESEQ